jgi:hypothetical protein
LTAKQQTRPALSSMATNAFPPTASSIDPFRGTLSITNINPPTRPVRAVAPIKDQLNV